MVWRVVAVPLRTVGSSAAFHAEELDRTLNELSSEGFNIHSMVEREEALIVTAHKLVQEPYVVDATVDFRKHLRGGKVTREYKYFYLHFNRLKDDHFPDLATALAAVRAHLSSPIDDCVPVSLIEHEVRKYDLEELPALLAQYPV